MREIITQIIFKFGENSKSMNLKKTKQKPQGEKIKRSAPKAYHNQITENQQ